MVCQTTDNGKRRLGSIAKAAREAAGMSMRAVAERLEAETGFTISPGAISDLESGNREPQWNTLAKIVALGYIINPHSGYAYTVPELFMVACEALDPDTGTIREMSACNS